MNFLSSMRSERGAITLSDVFIVLISVIFIGAVAVPFMLGQQADMNQRTAALNARSIAVDVETFLQIHPDDQIPEPVQIVHDATVQQLVIPLVTLGNTDAARIPFTLSSGISLPTADPSSRDLAAANVIYARDNYCVAVRSFGQIAYHNQDGPATSCAIQIAEIAADDTESGEVG